MPKKVLVVDDSPIARLSARTTLEGAGYSVVDLPDGNQLVATLSRERPDLVLMDVDMPGRTGDVVTTSARTIALHKCPFVLFSAKSATDLARLAKACGAVGFIEKSSDARAMLAKVRLYTS